MPSEIEAVRAFMLLGLFAQIGAVVVCVMLVRKILDKKIIAVILFAVSGKKNVSVQCFSYTSFSIGEKGSEGQKQFKSSPLNF